MQLKIIKIDPTGFTTGLFDLSIGSRVTPHLAKVEWLFCGRKSGHRAPPEAVDEAIALKKYARADSEVEKASCGAGRVDFEDF